MTKTSDALTNLSLALRDTITIIKEKLLEQSSTDKAALTTAQNELAQLQTQYQDALLQLANAPVDNDVAASITSATTELTAQLQDLVAIAQSATPASV